MLMLKIDFRNAFNTIRRDVILQLVHDELPYLYPFVHQNYAHKSNLYYGSDIIDSCEGVQQGDPVGSFLFSYGIMSIVKKMKSALNLWYLDDGTLAGDPDTVLNHYKEIIQNAANSHGLEINPSKCELYIVNSNNPSQNSQHNIIEKFKNVTPSIKLVGKKELTLLGAPIFQEAIEEVLGPKIKDLELMCSRLKEIDSHEAFFLLRNSFSMPKLTYFLRTSPCFKEEFILNEYDMLIKKSLMDILNINMTDSSWCQASLPVAKGGLGFRPASEVALAGFLSSFKASEVLANAILPSHNLFATCSQFEEAFLKWKLLSNMTCPPKNPLYQSEWDECLYEVRFKNLLNRTSSEAEIARLLAVSSPNSSDWLHAVPIPSLGLNLDPMSLKIACGLRLGSTICHPHTCICGGAVESNGRHGLACKKQMGRRSRHDEVNKLIKRALVQAKIPLVLEPSNLSRDDGKRPDGLSLTTWKSGKCLIWDFSCADSLCSTYVKSSSKQAGAAAEQRESLKIAKYSSLKNYHFIPCAIETFGSWGSKSLKFIKEIGKKMSEVTGEKRSTFFLSQSISIAIQRGNAACIIGTAPSSEGLEEIFDYVGQDEPTEEPSD